MLDASLKVSKFIDAVTTAFGIVARWLTVVVVTIGVFNVVTRYVGRSLGISLGGSMYIVLQTYAFDLIFLLGAAYVFRVDGHVRVDIVFSALKPRMRAVVDLFGNLLFLVPFAIMGIYFSLPYVRKSWEQREINLSADGIVVYPMKAVIIVGFALLIAQSLSEIIKHVAFLAGHPSSGSVHARGHAAEHGALGASDTPSRQGA